MRSKSCQITDDNYYEFMPDIGSDTVEKILNALREVYVASYIPVPEPNELAYNTLSISMFYDTKYNRLYLTYKLDKDRTVAIRKSDKELYNRIYDKVMMIAKEQDIKLSIIGLPTAIPENSNNRSYGRISQNGKYIRIDTQTIWRNIPGPDDIPYDWFIQNRPLLEDDIRKKNMHPRDVQEYCNRVVELNKNYLLSGGDMYEAFNDYKDIYNEYFDKELTPIEEWRAFTIYINVIHDFEKERLEDEDHDMGHVYDFDKVRKFIVEWGVEHGKIPQSTE